MKRSRVLRKLSFLLLLTMIITSIRVPVMAGTISAEDDPVIAEVTEDADTESFGITVATEDADAEYFGNVTNNEDVSPDEAKSYTDPDTGFYFEINDDNTAEITGYLNLGHSYDSLGDLNIPGTVKNDAGETFTVTRIGYQAFKSDTRFDGKLTIPDSVTEIGAEAFDGCVNLKGSLIIPDSVTLISFDAFRECNGMDGELKLGKNLEYIRDRAFKGCSNLKGDITIPASMIQIGESAFQGCTGFHGHLYFGEGSLEHIYKNAFSGLNITGGLTFPGRVSNIHDRAFYECKSLNGPLVFAKGVGYIGDFAFTDCKGLTGDLSLDTGDGDQTTIKDNSFKNCKNLGPVLTLGEKATWDNDMGMFSHSFLYCYGIKKVVNKSNNKFTLSALNSDSGSDKKHSWKDEKGNTINQITNGTAYRDDYAPEDEDRYYTITMQDGSEAYDEDELSIEEAKEGDLVNVVWLYEGDDKEFVRWESKNKGVKFKDQFDEDTTFVMPAEDVVITYVERECNEDIAVTGVTIVPSQLTVAEGQSGSLSAVVAPENATNKKVTWTIANPDVASIAEDGTVTGITTGRTRVTVKTVDGEKTATADIAVKYAAPTAGITDEKLTGLAANAAYKINGTGYTADENGEIPLDEAWYGKRISIVRVNTDAALNSDEQTIKVVQLWTDIKAGMRIEGLSPSGYVYTGSQIKPAIRIYDGETILTENKDYTVAYKNNVKKYDWLEGDAGFNAKTAPTVIVTGKGNYDSKVTEHFMILPADISGSCFSADNITLGVSNKAQKINPSLYFNGTAIKQKTDYTCNIYEKADTTYSKPLGMTVTDEGEYIVRFSGTGNFKGNRNINLSLTSDYKLVSALKIGKVAAAAYTGSPITPEPDVFDGKTGLTKNVDYTLSYASNVNPGTGYVIVTGKKDRGYAGSKRVSFKIAAPKAVPYDITPAKDTANRISMTLDPDKLPFMKGGAKPGVTVKYKGEDGNERTLVEGKDYKLTFKNNNVMAANKTPTVCVTGMGSFKGKREAAFALEEKSISKVTMLADDKAYANKAGNYVTKLTLTDEDGKALAAGKDYDKIFAYTYENETEVINGGAPVTRAAEDAVDKLDIIPAGTVIRVTASARPGSGYTETVSTTYRIVQTSITKAKIIIPDQAYTGNPIYLDKDDIKVLITNTQQLTSDDFEIVGYSSNTNKGTGYITIRGIGSYGGLKTQGFKIKAKGFK